ncbi:MAG: MerR family transcriptional regulator [Rhodospirillales bacterium]
MSDRAEAPAERRGGKSAAAFRTISEVATELDVPAHVLRFWETRFSQLRPLKRGGGRRYYRPEDVDLLRNIRRLLYNDGYTIKGVQKLLREKNPPPAAAPPPEAPAASEPSPPAAPAEPAPAGAPELDSLIEQLEALRDRLRRIAGS